MRARGFTLIEVLVALVIVAFGMGAVLAALSSSADNIAALREKTLAEWIALNQVADVRLNLNAPQPGVTEGDVKAFGNGDWHWRQDVIAVDAIPGMLEIAVRVKRLQSGDQSSSSSGASSPKTPARSSGNASSGAPSTFFSSSGGSSSSSGSSSGFGSSNLGQLSSSSGAAMQSIGASKLPAGNANQNWVATVIGFRGNSVSPASGEQPDWSCVAGASMCNGSSSGASSSSSSGTNLASPNTGATTGSSGSSSSGATSIIGSSSGS
jgi:general secretion pathway protein I